MKLHRLELEGFGPFLAAQHVDFDAFADDGIFLITGRTGAGKSSVLDGVCYALFGGVPRYDGAERRLRSDHCEPDDPTRVTLEFSAEGDRWRVTRSPEFERPKRRGGGTTKEPHRALLEVLAPEGWTGVAARPVDVAARLDEILGLTQQQFLQVILLAQNRFARFLLAKNDERLSLLRTLFGTRTFEQYAADLDERRKRAQERLAAEGVEVSTLLDEAERLVDELHDEGGSGGADAADGGARSVAERLARVVRAVERAEYRVDTLIRENAAVDARLDAALAAEREARSLADRHRERETARAALADLEGRSESIASARREAAAAAEAEALRPALDASATGHKTVAAADERHAAALARVRACGEVEAEGDLEPRADTLTALLARGESALEAESSLAAVDREVSMLRARADGIEIERQTLTDGRAEVPDMLAAFGDRLAQLSGADARCQSALAHRDETARRLEAAREAARLLDRRDQADLASLVRADELQRAVEAWTTLLRRRLAGAAVELAHELVDGEPCAVCGAREHPRPARGTDTPVSDADLAAAEERKNAAAESDRLASDAARVARDAHAMAAALAGGEDVEQLETRLAAAETTLASAKADIDEAERVRIDRDRAADLDAGIARRLGVLTDELAAARQEFALAQQRADALRAEVDAARGDFETVAARQRDLRARRGAVRELIAAQTALTNALETRRAADDALHTLIAGSSFADPDAVTAALRSAAERRRFDTTIAEYDAALAATRQRLLELELTLVDAGDDPVDVAPFAVEVTAAREAVQSTAAAHAAARALAERLRSLAQRADAGHAATAALADEHAVVARLADTVAGRAPNTRRMTLETFVLAAELEEIVTRANVRLEHMSAGRYRLQHTDALAARGAASGLGLEIMDAFTGQCRPPQSLSGGETFLTSLALALGLAEVVTARAGGLRLDTLFIDEGFGSLDDDTLDLAMRTLDELRQGGRTVGVISHVASMRDQLPAQLHVTATPRGPSVIRQDIVTAAG
ncbi:exonuclease SbcC [Microbacterium sp. SORGH_AS 1204]|uniref:AAA family ATPase n=1 Tax=Microbacterium sp. SORGH_AS_1204 TaxID=3041785 RepID=UPI002792AAD6|nr:SMC family ATPase [Microbacterium sp. SORGH_AS_1204]MDQ1135802.1 exonuclease SbcC [Microbacterium sp. SORGH_AS_1204]